MNANKFIGRPSVWVAYYLWACLGLWGHMVETGVATTYVVDQAAPGATDANPGTEERPFLTVQYAADLAKPGDTIYVMAGKYVERVKLKTSGSEGRPIAFVSKPRRSATISGFDLPADYIRVEGFEITADKPVTAVQLGGSHCAILDNFIHEMMAGVSGSVGKPSPDGNSRDYSAVAHNRIAYNQVYHCEYGFILGGEDWLVENNEVNRLFMYAPGNKNDDCDYSRFFGKGCTQRYNYYHGSTPQEIKTAHVDCLQTFCNNGEIAMDLLFEDNTCFDFHQMCMVESAPHFGNVRDWTFRRNIVSANSPTMRGGWGPDIIQTPGVTIENCTISTVAWAAIGLRGKESTGGQIRNNILCEAERAVDDRMDFTASNPLIEYNLAFKTAPLESGTNLNGQDPLFVDPVRRDFRLRKGSPAIAAGKSGATMGALEYPNVYYVDPQHPAALDESAWGYPAVPLATLAKACALAQSGETIVLRGGVYREVLNPKNDGVTVRAMKGEQVVISGADLIQGWRREPDGSWSAPLLIGPKKVLRDGQPWTEFAIDKVAGRITVKTGGDPRLHVFETVVREKGLDLVGREQVKIEGIAVVDTLSEPDLEASIEKNRMGTLMVEAPPGTEVVIEQQRHEFWFGAALANQAFTDRLSSRDRQQYLSLFLTNFNAAVTENALKWHDMEPSRGNVNYRTVDAILAWTDEHQIPLRGHNIYWGIPDRVQSWLKEMPDDELRETLKHRALDIGGRYRGRFAEYDLNNEMIHGNYYQQRLGQDITLQMAQWVRQGDSNAVLFVNDYDILTGVRLEDYVRHIRALLEQGVSLGGIGVQGHLHGETFDAAALRNALERLSQFNLPIRITEFNLPGQRSRFYRERNLRLTDAEEVSKARAITEYFRICFACPRVEGIMLWGFWEGANWIPVSSLYRRDWTPLPAAEAYRDLVFRQWWTRWQGRADAKGRCEVRAFYGQYRIKAGGKEQVVALRKSDGSKVVSFR